MANLNKAMLIGNLTRDPEMRVTPKGTATTSFAIAINRRYRDEAGADREEVTYVDIEAWGKTAETIGKYFTKGKPIFIEGRLRLDQWEDKTTKEKRSRMKVICENFQFLDSKGDTTSTPPTQSAPRSEFRSPPPRAAAPAPATQNLDEDLPF